MDINGARVLVAGATGVIGGAVAAELAARGARLALAGRDAGRLSRVSERLGGRPTARFEAYDLDACARAVETAARELGGLDAVLTAFGAVAFGRAGEVSDAVAEHLTTVNALAPAAIFRSALGFLGRGGVIAAVTGVVVERPQPAMADYCASKAALSAWLDAVRREVRGDGVRVLDIRPGHLETGFAARAVMGSPPPMPAGGDLGLVVRSVADALGTETERVRWDAHGTPVLERRAG
ncbi:SDR family NAD(P)-dependent oxidoreductase [Streptomyces sp. NPDC053755]|uniref:SDR family NAD(P)-dependent oxidoreductase n=1 Tax=Streptomyces sp. NPDC053755 TaxID=3155815 RepID=UPI00343F2851